MSIATPSHALTASHAEAILRCTNVRKTLDGQLILDDISLSVSAGEVLCLIGASGSGKSTLLRCIAGLSPIDSGTIEVAGINVHTSGSDRKALRRSLGIVFQQYNLFPHRTVLDNIIMAPCHVLGETRQSAIERAYALLDKVHLRDKAQAYPGELSGGQQQRIAIARSLAMQPRVMLFDEVTAALDPAMVREVLNVIRELAREGMTCILVTHEMGFAREVADTVCFTAAGGIVERAPAHDFFASPQDHRTRAFLAQIL